MSKLSALGMVFVLALLLSATLVPTEAQAETSDEACWGQATAVFAQMGIMGEHASNQPTPRLGLRNLARALYDDGNGPLEDDSIQSLGAFVVAELGLSVDACM